MAETIEDEFGFDGRRSRTFWNCCRAFPGGIVDRKASIKCTSLSGNSRVPSVGSWQRLEDAESSLKAPKEAGNLEGVEMSGWLFKVKAKDGRAVRLPKKRWVVLQGGTLIWYEDSKGEIEANSQTLQGAVCSMPLRSTGYAMTPAMKAFAELHKFPFMLSWPNGEVANEFVFAASTSADACTARLRRPPGRTVGSSTSTRASMRARCRRRKTRA